MAGESGSVRNFLDLPADCVAEIFSSTSPLDTCRSSTVSSRLVEILQSDVVWGRFLPSDYRSIISQSSDCSLLERFSSKKELYLSLCDNPILIDDGRKSIALDKSSGKKVCMISARDLKIAWGDNPTYWRWNSSSDSRFGEVAELICICWFEISGKITTKMLSPATMYEAYFVFQSKGAHGFEHHPAEATVGLTGTEGSQVAVYLTGDKGEKRRFRLIRRVGLFRRSRICEVECSDDEVEEYPRMRKDGWIEVKLGEFFNKDDQNGELEISILEVKGGFWKRDIVFLGIEIRPAIRRDYDDDNLAIVQCSETGS